MILTCFHAVFDTLQWLPLKISLSSVTWSLSLPVYFLLLGPLHLYPFFFFFSYQVRVFTKVYPLSLHELFACIFISFNFYFPSKCPNITTVLVSLKQQIILPNYNHHFLQSTFFFLSVKGMLFFIYNFYICYQDSTSYFRPLLLS